MRRRDDYYEHHRPHFLAFDHRRWPPAWRTTIIVDDDGLTEHFHLGRFRHTRWREVYGVERSEDHAIVHLAGRDLRIDGRDGGWRKLADIAAERSPGARGELRGEDLPPERIAKWLGVPVDGTLVCSNWRARWVLLAVLAVGLVDTARRLFVNPAEAAQGLAVMAFVGVLWRLIVTDVRADAHGLTLRRPGRWLRLPWSQIKRFDRRPSQLLTTTRGRFVLAGNLNYLDRLCATIEHVLAARQAGAVLPSDAPVPDGALSRLTDDDEAGDRALSVAAAPGDVVRSARTEAGGESAGDER